MALFAEAIAALGTRLPRQAPGFIAFGNLDGSQWLSGSRSARLPPGCRAVGLAKKWCTRTFSLWVARGVRAGQNVL
jgi:hypothetical protein